MRMAMEAGSGLFGVRSERSQDDGADEGERSARGNQVDVTHEIHG